MENRDNRMAWVLGVLIFFGVGYIAYSMLISPFLEKRAKIRALSEDLAKISSNLSDMQASNARLRKEVYKRSLPADIAYAREEYKVALERLLNKANITKDYKIDFKSGGVSMNVPNLDTKPKATPAYTRFSYSITIDKVDLKRIMTFLDSYYSMNLLHQITHFKLERTDRTSAASSKYDFGKERNDLKIDLTTEALVMDGAENRRTLFAVPTAAPAAMGVMAYHALTNNYKNTGRGISPPQLVEVLASKDREYTSLEGWDVFHGKLPEYPKIPPPPPAPTPPVKPDYSPYIKLTSLIQSSDGSAIIDIRDLVSNEDYVIEMVQKGEKLEISAAKYYYKRSSEGVTKAKDREHPRGAELELIPVGSRTKRMFAIHGIVNRRLILTEKPNLDEPEKATPAPKGPRPPGGGFAPKGSIGTKVDPNLAAIGGVYAARPPADKVFSWEVGQSLNEIQELKGKEAETILASAKQGLTIGDEPEVEISPPTIVSQEKQ